LEVNYHRFISPVCPSREKHRRCKNTGDAKTPAKRIAIQRVRSESHVPSVFLTSKSDRNNPLAGTHLCQSRAKINVDWLLLLITFFQPIACHKRVRSLIGQQSLAKNF